MTGKLSAYLDRFRVCLKIDSVIRDDVAQEIIAHLEDKSRELREDGLSEDGAEEVAMQALGPPELIAQQIYEVHAQGKWGEAFLAALPHLVIALFFALCYRQNVVCLSIVLAVIVTVVIYGWYHSKPIWVFPWMGYYLLTVLITGILLIYLSHGWGWVGMLIYVAPAFFVITYLMKQSARRDWLYASLMFAPVPVVFSWLLVAGTGKEFLMNDLWLLRLQSKTPWIVLSFLALAVATAIFIRLKQRRGKTVALLIPPIVILVLVTLTSRVNIGFWGWLILVLSLLAFAAPAWMQLGHRLRPNWLGN